MHPLPVHLARDLFRPLQQRGTVDELEWARSGPFLRWLGERARRHQKALRRVIGKAAEEFAHYRLAHRTLIALALRDDTHGAMRGVMAHFQVDALVTGMPHNLHLISRL